MSSAFDLSPIVDRNDLIGEGPHWDPDARRLLWLDRDGGVINEARPAGGAWTPGASWRIEGLRPLAAAIPRRGGGLVVLGGTEAVFLDEADGAVRPFTALAAEPGVTVFNDARCDASGRLWATVFRMDFQPRPGLVRIDPDGAVVEMDVPARLANGLAFAPTGEVLYFNDTLACAIEAFDVDPAAGRLSGRRTIADLPPGAGAANGMVVDREGCIWVAMTGAGEVLRFSPDGAVCGRAPLPVLGATSCIFGGDDLATLIVTTRRGRLPDIAREIGIPETSLVVDGANAGAVFGGRPGTAGFPGCAFAG